MGESRDEDADDLTERLEGVHLCQPSRLFGSWHPRLPNNRSKPNGLLNYKGEAQRAEVPAHIGVHGGHGARLSQLSPLQWYRD